MKQKVQLDFSEKGNVSLRLWSDQSIKKWVKLWGRRTWGKCLHILTFDCLTVILSFQSMLQKHVVQKHWHSCYQQGVKLGSRNKKKLEISMLHFKEFHLQSMGDEASLQLPWETLDWWTKWSHEPSAFWQLTCNREQKADWQPKLDINHSELCRSSILP